MREAMTGRERTPHCSHTRATRAGEVSALPAQPRWSRLCMPIRRHTGRHRKQGRRGRCSHRQAENSALYFFLYLNLLGRSDGCLLTTWVFDVRLKRLMRYTSVGKSSSSEICFNCSTAWQAGETSRAPKLPRSTARPRNEPVKPLGCKRQHGRSGQVAVIPGASRSTHVVQGQVLENLRQALAHCICP